MSPCVVASLVAVSKRRERIEPHTALRPAQHGTATCCCHLDAIGCGEADYEEGAMLRQMPPLEAAEAFLAAANARSFRAGASSLALSPSAFSRRIQQLERFLGVELFHRTNSQSQLSVAGRAYLAEVGPAIGPIRSEARREGKECGSKCRYRWGPG